MQDYKVILFGRSGAGKTTAINSVSEIPVISTEVKTTDGHLTGKYGTTVAFDYGEVTIPGGNMRMRLYGAPGQARFSFMLDILENNSAGILLLADNDRPDPLEETRQYLQVFKGKLMGCNSVALLGIVKSDLSPTPNIQQYRHLLHEEGLSFPVVIVDARCKNNVLLLLKVLFRKLSQIPRKEVLF